MIKQEELTFLEQDDQYILSLDNSTLFNQPGLPLMPMKTVTVTLPKNISVQYVNLTDFTLQKSSKTLSFQYMPFPRFWGLNETPLQRHADEIINQEITKAKQNNLYPGKTHSYIIGKNNTHTKIIVHLFPIHYQFNTKETYLINQGTISVSYTTNQEEQNSIHDAVENIIITHPTFLIQAQKLQRFHSNQGIKTEVINTNWIKSNFEPSSYPPVMGYKDFSYRDRIKKYDDELALKIISFLQSQSTNPNLQFITILGNAIHVPPSYYFGYNYYPVPTDFYYCSPDLDLIPNYRIGRLPVHTILEASQVVNKIINWKPTADQMDNVAIAGGIPFNSPFFIGELITVDSVNRGYFDGLTIDKYFRTNERFENNDILSALQNEYGLVFMISHGNANVIVAEEGRISARSLKSMPKNDNAPIFSCIACSSGSYDTYLIKQGFSFDKMSFGEGMLISKGGGIAYIGGSRTNDGYPILTLNNGRVEISKETYMAGLLTYVNKAYRDNVDNLGDLTFSAMETYLENNDLSDFWNQYHYFGFILLGDPALQFPDRLFPQDSYEKPKTTVIEQERTIPYNSEYKGTINLHAIDEQTIYRSQTDSPFITLKKIEAGNYQNIEVNTSTLSTQAGNLTFEFTPSSGSIKLLRFETIDGKEDWMYYRTARPVDDDYTSTTPGFGSTCWSTIQEAINQADEHDVIYVLNGVYNESIILNYPCILEGENKLKTIIDGQGNDHVILISSDGIIVEGFTIQHCGKNPWNAGISIQPRKSLKPTQIIVENNIITNNKNCGIYIDTGATLWIPTITISSNDITYNNLGIYVHDGPNRKNIEYNSIFGNNYGVYMVDSKRNELVGNTIENNYIGIVLHDVKKTSFTLNMFIDNTQHCQFEETTLTMFDQNYWDNWIGHLFNGRLPIPKLINGIHNNEEIILSQLKIDFRPLPEPILS